MVPDLKHIIAAVRNSKPWPFRSAADLCRYANACVVALHEEDPNFGHLEKSAGQSHCTDPLGRLTSRDVALYKSTGQIVDFILSAGFEPDPSMPEPANAVAWGVGPEGEYGPEKWLMPVAEGSTGPVDPEPEPEPEPHPEPPPPPAPNLEPRVTALEALLEELVHQQGMTNEAIARLDRRRYRGTGRLPYGLGNFTVNVEPI